MVALHLRQSIAKLLSKFSERVVDKFIQNLSSEWQEQVKSLIKTMQSVDTSLQHIAITSQVCATRQNQMEWRDNLRAVMEWHGVSAPSAYRLWQLGAGRVPTCPMNASTELTGGKPMSLFDEVWEGQSRQSNRTVPKFTECDETQLLESYTYDVRQNIVASRAGAVHGQTARAVSQWSAVKVAHVASMAQWVSALEVELVQFIAPGSPSDGRSFLTVEATARLAALATAKVHELVEMQSEDDSFRCVYDFL